MKEYFFNVLVMALACALLAALTFLIGREGATAGAVTAGALYGVVGSLAYCFGGMMNEDDGTFNGKRLLAMLIAGVVAGVAGGFLIGVG